VQGSLHTERVEDDPGELMSLSIVLVLSAVFEAASGRGRIEDIPITTSEKIPYKPWA
jgi:hypothetical protein